MMPRLAALIRKETIQVVRDPSVLFVAFVLPPIMLFLLAYAISLDVKNVKFGVVLEGDNPAARSLLAAYQATEYLDTQVYRHANDLRNGLVVGQLKGGVVIPADFQQRLTGGTQASAIQIGRAHV